MSAIRNLFFTTLFIFIASSASPQTFTFSGWADTGSPLWRGRTYTKDGYIYTNTQSGVTMSARVNKVGGNSCTQTLLSGAVILSDECFSSNDPSFTYNCSPDGLSINGTQGLWLANNWSDKNSSDQVDVTFSAPIRNVNFKINDINNDGNWSDVVILSAVNCSGTTIYPTVTGLTGNFTYNSSNGTIYNTNPAGAYPDGNTGTDITVNFGTNVITSLQLIYKSNATLPLGGSDPTYQYICLGDISFNTYTVSSVSASASPTVICSGNSTTITATAGFSSYIWSPGGATTQIITVSPTSTTTYYVTATDAGGCTTSNSVSVTVNSPAAEAGVSPGTITCTTTSFQLNGSGGGSYSWTTSDGNIASGATTATPTINAGGTYILTIDLGGGCTASDNVVVAQNTTPPTADAGISPGIITCATTSLQLTASGGGTYSWSASGGGNITAGANTATPTIDAAGTYTVTVTGANGCTATDNITISSSTNPPDANAVGGGPLTCTLTSINILATGGGTYSWSASGGGNITAGANTSTPTINAPGTYTVTVTSATNGCTDTDDVIISQDVTLPSANAGNDQSVCPSQSAILVATGGGSYSWSTGDNNDSTTVTPSSTSTYTVTVTSATNGCTASDDVVVSVGSSITADAGADTTICAGQSVILTASGGSNYAWSSGDNTASTSISPSSTTTYTVTVSSGSCSGIDSVIVTVNPLPSADAGNDQALCSGDSILLIATGGGTYLWDNSSANDSIMITPSSTTTYSVTVTNNGCSASDDITITVNLIPSADAGPDTTICSSQSVTLTASGGSSYSWSNGDNTASTVVVPLNDSTFYVTVTNNGCSAMDSVSVIVNPIPTADAGTGQTICNGDATLLIASGGGTYLWSNSSTNDSISVSPLSTSTFTVTVTNNGCSASDNVTVTVNPLPDANAGNAQTICEGQIASLTASGGGTYLWNNSMTTATINISPSTSTTYTVTVTSNGCTAEDSVAVTVNPNPVADAGTDQSICGGESATIIASGGGTYLWSNSETTATINVSPASTTTFTVTVTFNGCTDTDNITITLYPAATADAGFDQGICYGQTVYINASGGGSYLWNTGDTTSTIDETPAFSATYSVTVTNSYGCSATDDVNITVYAIPTVALTSDPANYSYIGQIVTFTATPEGYTVYNFYVDNILVQSGPSNIYQNNTLTNGQVVSVTAGNNGCSSDIDSMNANVKPIPNAFTPDGNGKNDIFVPGLDLTIINRWDQVLYEGFDGWDGKVDDKYASPGTYYYIIRIPGLNHNTTILKGSVTLIDNKN